MAQAQTPPTIPGVEEGITPPPDLDSAQPGDPVEEEEEGDQGEDSRPDDLPPGVDSAQPGDPVEEEEDGVQGQGGRPDNLPPGVDPGQPGDPVGEGVSGQADTAPAPTGLRVTASDDDSVSLSWNAVTNAAAYRVDYRKSGSTKWIIGGYAYSVTSRTVYGLDCNATYQFRVSARGNGGTYSYTYGTPSTSVSKKTALCIVSAPTGLKVTASDDESVSLSWSAVTNAAAYRVEYRKSGSTKWIIDGYVYSGTSREVDGLDCPNTSYDFRVRARGNGKAYSFTYSSPSSSVTRKTSQCRAPAPTGLKVTGSDEESVSLTWKAVPDAGAYRVEYLKSGSSKWTIDGYVYSGTSHTVDGLEGDTTYFFRVRTRGDGNPYSFTFGKSSTSVSRKTSSSTLDPPTSLSLSVETGDDDDLDLTYTRSGESTHYYQFELHRSSTEAGTYTLADTENDSVSPANFDDQTKGYWYQARGRNCKTSSRTQCGDWSEWSDSILLPDALEPPSGLSLGVESGDDDDLAVTFTQSGPPHFYRFELHRSTSETGVYTLAHTVDASTSPADFNDQDKGYWYKARGKNCQTSSRTDCGDWSDFSGAIELRSAVLQPLSPPTGLSITVEPNDKDLDVAFTPSEAPHFYQFELYRSDEQHGSYTRVATESATFSPADFDYQAKGHWYKARARNCRTLDRTDCGSWSIFTSAIELPEDSPTPYDAPAPTGLGVTATTETRVSLSWDTLTDGYRYMVEYSTAAEGPWAAAFSELSRTNYIAYGLDCNTTYYFRISARGDGSPYTTDYGSPSIGTVSATTGTCTNPSNLASAPTGLKVTSSNQSVVRLSWNSVTNAAAYKVERSDSLSGPWSTVRFPTTGTIRNDDIGLECGTTYYYRVRARGDGSPFSTIYGKPSATITGTTSPCTPTVEILGLPTAVEEGRTAVFRVMASHLDSRKSYVIRVAMDNADLGFDSLCTDRMDNVTVPAGRSSHTTYLTLYGCDTSGGTVSATLLVGSATVATATPFTVAVTPPSMITSSPESPYTGQRVTLRASSPSSYGTASSYQWQEWSNGQWTNLGTASTSRRYSTRSTSAQTRTFRVVVTYTSGETESSAWIAVEWRSIVVTVAASPENPESGDASKRKITLTATADAPSGVTYQWQQGSGSRWTNLGSRTTLATRDVSFTTRGTRKFRVQVRHASASSVVSEPVYVTWDEWAIVAEMVTALQKAVTEDSTYVSAQKALVDCMNTGTGGASGAGGGNATSTPPTAGVGGASTAPTPTFTSFDDILEHYAGETKAKMETGVCSTEATKMFSTNQSLYNSKLANLKTTKAEYSSLLETPQGSQFEANVGDPDALRQLAHLGAAVPEPGTLNAPLYGSTAGGTMGASAGPTTPVSLGAEGGLDCLPTGVDGDRLTLANKLKVLNCLVFSTPHGFWVAQSFKTIDNNALKASGRFDWINYGDWRCSAPFEGLKTLLNGPVPSCLKHDVGYGLQRLAGIAEDGKWDTELDEAWNPRNKALADLKFRADIMKHGCQNPTEKARNSICRLPKESMASWIYYPAVAYGNDKGWPVTKDDLSNVDSAYRFVNCTNPKVIAPTAIQLSGWSFRVTWVFEQGTCAPTGSVDHYSLCAIGLYDERQKAIRYSCENRVPGTVNSVDFFSTFPALVEVDELEIQLTVHIVPRNREYGSGGYPPQYFRIVLRLG